MELATGSGKQQVSKKELMVIKLQKHKMLLYSNHYLFTSELIF